MAHKLIRPAGIGLAGAAAALAVATAGPAAADVSAAYINVVGTTFVTGQTYTIQVTVPPGASATVQDTTSGGAQTNLLGIAHTATADSTIATLQWIPSNPGTHGIWATVLSTSVSTGTAMVNVTGTTTGNGTGSANYEYGTGSDTTSLKALPVIGPILTALGL
ncbi:hypothetical protein [Nocardia stercoris]|uniref:Uncharacterized protein n=1 Tax=Nocardia stercoris TaxID=2483361 RepID=A0A3M2KTA5_9NOCA|nr:hypothetical protein [Nocardia stercoris]RMI28689.1 hypothetical protein EBN03_29015 [Nocardia stercoris]